MPTSISTPTITINNETIAIVPNSFSYTEGFGEQMVKTQSAGGGTVSLVYSTNAENQFSDVKFSIYNTKENISLARSWKAGANLNTILATDSVSGMTKTFLEAALTNNYEVKLGADTTIDLEFKARQAIGD